jgi:ubiquinone/menaquinone biosynthesis C-methylase UbiE
MAKRSSAKEHDTQVQQQFSNSAAYLRSRFHSRGDELALIRKMVAGRKRANAIDLGCGAGHVCYVVAPHIKSVVAYDLSNEMLSTTLAGAKTRKLTNIVARQGSVERLPFDDETFDFVFTRYAARHWHSLTGALQEARRVMRKDGIGVFVDTIPPDHMLGNTFQQTIELLRDISHVKDYSLTEWKEAVDAVGLVPLKIIRKARHVDFRGWVERIGTPAVEVRAIRSLQSRIVSDVRKRFKIRLNRDFMFDTITMVVRRARPDR